MDRSGVDQNPVPSVRAGVAGSFGVAVRRLDAEQVPDEEVIHPPLAVGTAHAVVGVGDDQQLEILAGLDQGIDQPHRRLGRDVGVHLADDQQQLALQPVGVVDVGRLGVLRADRVAHPLLVPGRLVHPVVVAAAGRDGDLVELGMEQHAARRVLAAGRGAVDPHAGQVVLGIFLARRPGARGCGRGSRRP